MLFHLLQVQTEHNKARDTGVYKPCIPGYPRTKFCAVVTNVLGIMIVFHYVQSLYQSKRTEKKTAPYECEVYNTRQNCGSFHVTYKALRQRTCLMCRIWGVPPSNIGPDTVYPDRDFVIFLSYYRTPPRKYPC